jgi:hypothetical protein
MWPLFIGRKFQACSIDWGSKFICDAVRDYSKLPKRKDLWQYAFFTINVFSVRSFSWGTLGRPPIRSLSEPGCSLYSFPCKQTSPYQMAGSDNMQFRVQKLVLECASVHSQHSTPIYIKAFINWFNSYNRPSCRIMRKINLQYKIKLLFYLLYHSKVVKFQVFGTSARLTGMKRGSLNILISQDTSPFKNN